jgi:type II secretory pathway pseudopilin PulG
MRTRVDSARGITLIETMIAMLVLTVGAIGMASLFMYGMQSATSSPNELVATQKAAEAIESVFSARDSHTLTWAQLSNVSAGGIFLDGATPMTTAGLDGVLNTADDGPVESTELPGPDQTLGTEDDTTQTLIGFTREIVISELDPVNPDLRDVTVNIIYQAGTTTRTYSLSALISRFA